jgi:hypothetical protein
MLTQVTPAIQSQLPYVSWDVPAPCRTAVQALVLAFRAGHLDRAAYEESLSWLLNTGEAAVSRTGAAPLSG